MRGFGRGGWLRIAIMAAALIVSQQARAAGTEANTTITSTATVSYKIGDIDQPQVQSQTSFVVDRKIDVVVAEVGSTDTQVIPGATQQVATFTITNTSNATLDFGLTVGQPNGGIGPRGNSDNFDVTSVQIYLDNGNGTFSAAEDTAVTSLDELEPSTGAPGVGQRTVFVVVSIPSNRVNGDVAVIALTAQAREGGQPGTLGAIVAETAGADTAGMDTVFADGDGPGADDGPARDGKHSDDDAFVVSVTALSVTKTVTLVSDTINGTTNPKAIPGAILEYCLLLDNAGGTAATAVNIADTLPAQVAYKAGTLRTGATCATANTVEDDDSDDGSDSDGFAASVAAGVLTGQVATLASGGTAAIRFQVEVK